MGSNVSRTNQLLAENRTLANLLANAGDAFPGSDYHPLDRRNWMSELGHDKLRLNQIVWPGTHNSATNDIGIPYITRAFGACQDLSIYQQLNKGVRVLDIRVGQDRRVSHGILRNYSVDVVIDDVRRFLSETSREVLVLQVRTASRETDPPELERYLVERLGENVLIHQDDRVFGRTLAELLPRRVICIWKTTVIGGPIWSERYMRDNWIGTDMPHTKFENNMNRLGEQPPSSERNYFYRVENTLTHNINEPNLRNVTERIRVYARLFISQSYARGISDRLQVISTDFVNDDFVDACVGLTRARML